MEKIDRVNKVNKMNDSTKPPDNLEPPVTNEITLSIKEPRLAPIEKLYVRAYTSTLDHSKALKILHPELKQFPSKNKYSKREAVAYHIQKYVVSRISSEGLDSNTVMDLLLQEATRLGAGSSPTARVQALTLLGKELGLFQERVIEKEDLSFNIINYGTVETVIPDKIIEVVEETPIDDSIEIEKFN